MPKQLAIGPWRVAQEAEQAQQNDDIAALKDAVAALQAQQGPLPLPMMLGAATDQTEVAFELLESKVGPMGIRRTYEKIIPATFQVSAAFPDVGKRASWVSVKSDWAQMASGALDGVLTGYLKSVPDDHTLLLTWQHEPENDGSTGAAFVAGFQHFYALVKVVRPQTKVGPIFIGWTFDPHNSRTTQTSYADPLGGSMDFAGIDTYQGYRWPAIGSPLKWDPVPLAQLTAFVTWCQSHSIPPAVGETACACDPSGQYDVAAKVDFITRMVATADDAGALALCWFNTMVNGDMDPSQMIDAQPESLAAWSALLGTHATSA